MCATVVDEDWTVRLSVIETRKYQPHCRINEKLAKNAKFNFSFNWPEINSNAITCYCNLHSGVTRKKNSPTRFVHC